METRIINQQIYISLFLNLMIVLMCKSNISNLLPKLTGAIY